jgi:ADP-heptose:LPS heptosyltransferase
MTQKKILLLRFSSFGDVTQCLSVPTKLAEHFPQSEIHWAIREDLASLLLNHPHIHRIWSLSRTSKNQELWAFARKLSKENFTHVYDAHNSTRSHIISLILKITNWKIKILRKSQKRWKRFLLFSLRINTYRMPFSGQRDLLEPLKKWGISEDLPAAPQLFLNPEEIENVKYLLPKKPFVALAPSAAFPLKRWPIEYWKELVRLSSEQNFVLLGGPDDHFIEEIKRIAPHRVINLSGKTDLRETSAIVKLSQILIVNDTGTLHTAEQQGHPTIALMGPAPFGFPSRNSTVIMERDFACRPCSKHGQGPCVNPVFQKCLRDIVPQEVHQQMLRLLKS